MEAGPRDREQHEAVLGDPTAAPSGDLPGDPPDEPPLRPADDVPAVAPGLTPDGPDDAVGTAVVVDADEVEVELRPQRRLRIWQLAPIVGLAAVGSLMFAFPLAFGSGDGGAVVAMLGLLISSCAAGWGVMAARKVGHTWPGLPARGSGERPDWRVLALYMATIGALVALAVWRVARLR
ncbi:hypothetical protein [Streptomyces cinereoruber]|uniref:hypothetical protein n=1 Tax=Streptomyces cinereoruber TaxID=67260 RepID=UPI003C2BE304